MRLVAPSRLWLLLVLGMLVALVYWPSTAVLYAEWSDFVNITFTHGWLILAVSLFLIWRDRREIASAPAHPWPLALIGLAGAILAWMICYRAGIQDLHITIYPALFWFAVAGAFGWPVARLLLFPVAFFCFALPSWAQLGDVLQELTVLAMRGFLGLTGPHAVIDGALIHIPNGSFAIEEGCSGLHFMIVGLAVAALHGELRRDPWRTRLAETSPDGRPCAARQLGARLRRDRGGLSHRYAPLPGERQSLLVWLGGVRRGAVCVLLAEHLVHARAAAAAGRAGGGGSAGRRRPW